MGFYETSLKVRFAQVDYAGIMFYPRFFENFHAVFEDMFGDRLGVPYMSILTDRRIGFPTVSIKTAKSSIRTVAGTRWVSAEPK